MYRIPDDLDLSKIVGQFTTQLLVGQYDMQFSFGDIRFAIESPIELYRDGAIIGSWIAGAWPPPQFFDVMNSNVISYEIPNNRTIVIRLENNIEVHLCDNSDQFECMKISIGDSDPWII